MIAWYDALFTLSFWALTCYLWRPSEIRKGGWKDHRVLGTRLFALCLAISFLFQVDPLGADFDAVMGVHNLSWVFGYVSSVIAIYAGMVALANIRRINLPPLLPFATICVVACFGLLLLGLVTSPEELHDDFPTSLAALLFREALYSYLLIVSFFGFKMFRDLMTNEKLATGQLRGFVMMFAFVVAFVFCTLRWVVSLVAFFSPDLILSVPLLRGSNLILVLCIMSLIVGLAPAAWLRFPVRLLVYTEQQRTLYDLEYCRGRLVALTGKLPWIQPSYADRWFNPPFVMYCSLIDILDRRMLLKALLEDETFQATDMHYRVASLLEHMPDTDDWVELVKHVRQVAHEI